MSRTHSLRVQPPGSHLSPVQPPLDVQNLIAQVSDLIELNKELQANNSHFEQRLLVLESEYDKQIRELKSQLEQRTLLLEEE